MTNKILNLSGMHCASCSLIIEGDLSDLGVQAKANYAKQTVAIAFDENNIKESIVIDTIEKLGYQVLK